MLKILRRIMKNKSKRKLQDYTKVRNELVKGCEKVADSKWFFYYDETENYGKIKIDLQKKGGLNINPWSSPFVLGGIWSEKEITNDMADELITTYAKITQATDIKFKNIFGRNCSFDKIICSNKLDPILNWMEKYDVFFHFVERNILNDIAQDLYESLQGERNSLEVEKLRAIITNYSDCIMCLLHKYEYPHIKESKRFWNDLLNAIPFSKLMIPKKKLTSIEDMVTIIDNELIEGLHSKICKAADLGYEIKHASAYSRDTLTEDFSADYLLGPIVFKNGTHYFDNESIIKGLLERDQIFINRKQLNNYSFVNATENGNIISEEVKAVYVSDWIIRILQQTILYFYKNDESSFYRFICSLSEENLSRFIRFCKILNQSDERNPFSFRFFDVDKLKARFGWLHEYEETIVKARLLNQESQNKRNTSK